MELKEWFMKAPWGNIALLSYGDPKGKRVLLCHGRLDSAATFIPLLKLLPKKFYFVVFDQPGNGKSDPFPKGGMLFRFMGVAVMDIIIKHLGWKSFILMGHSLGAEQCLFYTAIYPKRVKRAVYFDIGPSVAFCRTFDFPRYFKESYDNFYDNYNKKDYVREYTKQQAIRSLRNARALNEEQAELVLSRNLIELGPDTYKFSWDRRYKNVPGFNSLQEEFYMDIFSAHPTPSLFICANAMKTFFYQPKSVATKLLSTLTDKYRNVNVIWVEGDHDVHLTHPERFIDELVRFLNDNIVSKL